MTGSPWRWFTLLDRRALGLILAMRGDLNTRQVYKPWEKNWMVCSHVVILIIFAKSGFWSQHKTVFCLTEQLPVKARSVFSASEAFRILFHLSCELTLIFLRVWLFVPDMFDWILPLMIQSFYARHFPSEQKLDIFYKEQNIIFRCWSNKRCFSFFFYDVNQIIVGDIKPWHILYSVMTVPGCRHWYIFLFSSREPLQNIDYR